MEHRYLTRSDDGLFFEDGADRGRIIVSGASTDGRYSVLEWKVGTTVALNADEPRHYFCHRHFECEETFHIQSGSLEFMIEEQVVTLRAGDHMRVPPGTRHGYANPEGNEVSMLVTFVPGGFEQLFVKYRTDEKCNLGGPGFVDEATADFASEFED